MNRIAQLIATYGGIGYMRPAPGTWGSLGALPAAWLLFAVGGFPAVLTATLALTVLGIWATQIMTHNSTDHDPSEIVVDEVVGQFIALMPILYAAWRHDIDVLAMWPGWIAAFALFRLFDITKPSLVGRADRRGDALGVMLDDIYAGLFAAIGVVVLAGLWHGVLGW